MSAESYMEEILNLAVKYITIGRKLDTVVSKLKGIEQQSKLTLTFWVLQTLVFSSSFQADHTTCPFGSAKRAHL